ncbi:hypothetical protein NHX12_026267 [Muraenolepis orangiensis]|uniref:Uncharacterized protein n=1 Tax=Muraenolepis orangiensis TaxID=630683 RepID=A0A9Q0IQK2_9TELE|nr:hypothetical protein NHX12_026267 [Muraenolepis orangiensis]
MLQGLSHKAGQPPAATLSASRQSCRRWANHFTVDLRQPIIQQLVGGPEPNLLRAARYVILSELFLAQCWPIKKKAPARLQPMDGD